MLFSKKNSLSYNSTTKNFKLKIEDKFKKEDASEKMHIWPEGYERFSAPKKKEKNYYIAPQKFNYKILFFSIIVVILIWIVALRPLKKEKTQVVQKDDSVKVLILKDGDWQDFKTP